MGSHDTHLAPITRRPSASSRVRVPTRGGPYPPRQAFIPGRAAREAAPFGPVVASHPGAGATERLANWSGYTRP